MPYAISATYPLGYYQGRSLRGETEAYPSPARLYAALMAGAYALERLEGREDGSDMTDLDGCVFDWLEAHPPAAMVLPEARSSTSTAISFRNRGGIEDGRDARKEACPASARSFLNGSVTWFWFDAPGDAVAQRLCAIVAEVPYLGEATCPVVMGAFEVEEVPANALFRCVPSFSARECAIVVPGRRHELQRHYRTLRAFGKTIKDVEKTKKGKDVSEGPSTCLASAFYERRMPPEKKTVAPWTHGYLLHVDDLSPKRPLVPEDYVAWALCLHRALVRQFGDDLPGILQRVGSGSDGPANGLAIQVLPAGLPVRGEYDSGGDALLVMIPAGAPAEEEAQVLAALTHVTSLYAKSLGTMAVTLTGERLDLAHFWRPVPANQVRVFETVPLFMPDGRPPTKRRGSGAWSVDDDARLAVGHVWRDLFPIDASLGSDARRHALSDAVRRAGIAVSGGRVVATRDVRRFTHRTPSGSALVALRALVGLSAIGCEECLAAIGQTRHLGGGLLVPIDIPIPVQDGRE